MVKVIVKNYVKKEKVKHLVEMFIQMKNNVEKYEGCLSYNIYKDEDNEKIITLIHEWETIEHVDNYYKSSYFLEVLEKLVEYLEKESEINIYSKIS
ncbi:MAG: antibiotic biosynthesis monooxygenase [Fusobacteriaceae bacterium]|nr:antibiotic biosynthesis monooxygenase [Fusobacteriaceae bacterium]MBN2839209.1 antibiotic biosynthesis monooxygenase [Fusobacteriaceae bacterium]